jgi:hypothetical protein
MFPNYRTTQWHYNKISKVKPLKSMVVLSMSAEKRKKIKNCHRLLLKRGKKRKIGFGWLFLRCETFCGSLEAV